MPQVQDRSLNLLTCSPMCTTTVLRLPPSLCLHIESSTPLTSIVSFTHDPQHSSFCSYSTVLYLPRMQFSLLDLHLSSAYFSPSPLERHVLDCMFIIVKCTSLVWSIILVHDVLFILHSPLLFLHSEGSPKHSGSTLDCWSSGQVTDSAQGVWFRTKFISLVQVVPGPV